MENSNIRVVLDTAKAVQDNCASFCEAYALSYIQLRRTFDDGSFLFLTNTPLFFIDFIERYHDNLPASFQGNGTAKDTVYLSCDCVPPLLASLAKDKHNIYGALSFTSSHVGYCDLFTVGIAQPRHDTGTFFMNILHDIKAFQPLFLEKHDAILPSLIKKGLFTPPKSQDKEPTQFYGTKGVLAFTDHENALMSFLLSGKTIEDIARHMHSPLLEVHQKVAAIVTKIGQPLHTINAV